MNTIVQDAPLAFSSPTLFGGQSPVFSLSLWNAPFQFFEEIEQQRHVDTGTLAVWQNLDRNFAIQFGVDGPVDSAHAAFSKL